MPPVQAAAGSAQAAGDICHVPANALCDAIYQHTCTSRTRADSISSAGLAWALPSASRHPHPRRCILLALRPSSRSTEAPPHWPIAQSFAQRVQLRARMSGAAARAGSCQCGLPARRPAP
eukprot:3007614-Rhodomonas_salina.1